MKTTSKKQRSLFATNIARRRKDLGWNQSDLAEKAGIGLNTLKDIERDVSQGWPDTRQAIATALGCGVDELFAGEVKTTPSAKAMADVIAAQQKEIEELRAALPKEELSEIIEALNEAPHAVINIVRGVLQLPPVSVSKSKRSPA